MQIACIRHAILAQTSRSYDPDQTVEAAFLTGGSGDNVSFCCNCTNVGFGGAFDKRSFIEPNRVLAYYNAVNALQYQTSGKEHAA